MRSPTSILIAVLLVLLISGCSSGTSIKYITGNVISRPSQDEINPRIIAPDSETNQSSETEPKSEEEAPKELVAIETESEKELLKSVKCGDDNINLGYKSCHNTSNGLVKIFLKNSGYDPIAGLWFNIEVNDKSHYESTDIGLYDNSFVEYVLDLPRWREDYGSTDRIIIIPVKETPEGERLCHNRALLLEPLQSCTAYEYRP